jgi:hypothetical protein
MAVLLRASVRAETTFAIHSRELGGVRFSPSAFAISAPPPPSNRAASGVLHRHVPIDRGSDDRARAGPDRA